MVPGFYSTTMTTEMYSTNYVSYDYRAETYADVMEREARADYARRRAGSAGQVPPVDVELASDPVPENRLDDLVVDALTRSVVRRRRERRPFRSRPGARR